jgi:hypothetical protein
MPGMRRQRATGEPRLRGPGAGGPQIRSCPPTATNLPVSAAEPIQERVPRMARAPQPSPPPSPPAKDAKSSKVAAPSSPVKPGSRALVKTEVSLAKAAYDTRLQTHSKVLPPASAMAEAGDDEIPETWDDRSVRQIVWGIAREHTLIGAIAAFLYGEGRKLSTTAQATQLLFGTMIGLLFLSCAQLRYSWLGPEWLVEGTTISSVFDPYSNELLVDRATVLCAVGAAAALVGWPCAIVSRWLFLVANRTRAESTRRQAQIIFGSAWSMVLFTCAALAVGAISMASNMDATVVQQDVMVGWVLAMVVEWLLLEPTALFVYAAFTLLLKWCTSFDDLPEIKEEMVKQQKLEVESRKATMKQLESAKPLQLTSKKKVP